MACSLKRVCGVRSFVGLDFQDEVVLEWMGNFVACKEDCGVEKELTAAVSASSVSHAHPVEDAFGAKTTLTHARIILPIV